MPMLPPPSEEQLVVLSHLDKEDDVVCTAVAGAGKSTLLLHACVMFEHDSVVVVAYNAILAAEMNERLNQLRASTTDEYDLRNATAYTFHSLASKLFRNCPDDITLAEICQEQEALHRQQLLDTGHVTFPMTVDHLMLDEMQDMRDLYHRFLCIVFPLKHTHTFIVGDEEQELYGFETDDPSRLEYMASPESYFRNRRPWVRLRLSISWRLTPANANLVNHIKQGLPLVGGNTAAAGLTPIPTILSCSPTEWKSRLLPIVAEMCRVYAHDRVAILVRSVKNNLVRAFINAITLEGIADVYVHGVDCVDNTKEIKSGKHDNNHKSTSAKRVMVCSHYAAKGLTFDAALTIGASEEMPTNPLYVAVSRARFQQVLVVDRRDPPCRLIKHLGSFPCIMCPQTKQLVTSGGFIKAPKRPLYEETRVRHSAFRDVTEWSLRGRGPEIHEQIVCIDTSMPASALPTQVVLTGGVLEEVSSVYLTAVLCAEEWNHTRRCARLEQILHPQRVDLADRAKRIIAGETCVRYVDLKAREDEMLSAELRTTFLRDFVHKGDARAFANAEIAIRWMATAIVSTAFGSYFHRAQRLLHSLREWFDYETFDMMQRRVQDALGATYYHDTISACAAVAMHGGERMNPQPCEYLLRFDHAVHLSSIESGFSVYRCHVCKMNPITRKLQAFLFVLSESESATPAHLVKACIPLALSPDDVSVTHLVNLTDGCVRHIRLTDKSVVLRRMELMS